MKEHNLFGARFLFIRYCIVLVFLTALAVLIDPYVGRRTAIVVATFGAVFATLLYGVLIAGAYVMERARQKADADLRGARRKK